MRQSKEISLSSSFELKGRWWLEGRYNQDEGKRGSLSYDPNDKTTLSLDTPLSLSQHDTDLQNNLTLYGMLDNGKTCSLCNCFPTSVSLFDKTASEFVFNKAFIGKGFVDADSKFVSAFVSFPHIGEWLRERPIGENLIKQPSGRFEVGITYRQPKKKCIQIPAIQASLRFSNSFQSSSDFLSASINHQTEIQIVPNTKRPLEWYWEQIWHLRILFTLLVGTAPKISSLSFKEKSASERVEYCARLSQDGLTTASILWPEMPFPYQSLAMTRKVFKQWFERRPDLNHLCELYYGVKTNPSLPVDFRFIALTQGLESYHRATGEGDYLEAKDYDAVKSALIANIPSNVSDALKEALKSRIRYGNQFSLRKRLQELLKDIPESICQKIFDSDPKFINRIVDTRNYLTHRDEELSCAAMKFDGQFNVCEQMKMLIEFILLREAGFNLDQLENAFCNHIFYKHRPQKIHPF